MLVRLTNKGDAMRIIYDRFQVQRIMRPGQSVDADIPVSKAEKFMAAFANGDTMEVEFRDDLDKARADEKKDAKVVEPQKERQEPFTLLPGEGIDQPQDRKDVDKVNMRQRPATETPPDDEVKDPYEGETAEQPLPRVPRMTPAKRIEAQAANNARPDEPPPPPKQDPTTAIELLDRAEEFSVADLLKHANAILPKNTLPGRPKFAAIVAALTKHAKKEGQKPPKT